MFDSSFTSMHLNVQPPPGEGGGIVYLPSPKNPVDVSDIEVEIPKVEEPFYKNKFFLLIGAIVVIFLIMES